MIEADLFDSFRIQCRLFSIRHLHLPAVAARAIPLNPWNNQEFRGITRAAMAV